MSKLFLLLLSFTFNNIGSTNELLNNIETYNSPFSTETIETSETIKSPIKNPQININNEFFVKKFYNSFQDSFKDYYFPPMHFTFSNGIFSNSGINTYNIGFILGLVFSFFLIRKKQEDSSLFESILLKRLPNNIFNLIEKTPKEFRNFFIKRIFQVFLENFLNIILGSPITTKFFLWILFEVKENKEFIKKINISFIKCCFMAIILHLTFNFIVWNMKESNSILYFNIIKVFFTTLVSFIFLWFCIYETSDKTPGKKQVKLDLLDLNKFVLYSYYILKFASDKNEGNFSDLIKNSSNIINTVNDRIQVYKSEFEKAGYMDKFFLINLTAIGAYMLYYEWFLINTLTTLEKSKQIYKKENKNSIQLV